MNNKLLETIKEMNTHWEERLHNGTNSVWDNMGPNIGDGAEETDLAGTSNNGQDRANGQNLTNGWQEAPQFSPNGLNSPNYSTGGRSSSRGWPNS